MMSSSEDLEVHLTATDRNILRATRSNAVILSSAETAIAKAQVVNIRNRIQELKDRIEELETLLSQEKMRLTSANVALAPHKRLPREILAVIFSYTVEGSPMRDPLPRISCYCIGPWSIRHVCSLWREIILSQHTIWNNLVFDVCESKLQAKGKSLEVHTEFWRENIDQPGHPLSLTIPFQVKFQKTESRIAFIEENVIRANSGRLREFYLESDILSADFLATPPISFPILHTLRLPLERLNNLPAALLSSGMPSLRTCLLDGKAIVDGISELHLPWAQLTFLSITGTGRFMDGVTMRCAREIFQCCSNLDKLALRLKIISEDTPSDPVRHTCLRYLLLVKPSLKGESQDTPLDFLIAPSLLHLDLRTNGQQFIGTAQLASWIRRSGCRLTSLRLWPIFGPRHGDHKVDLDVDVLFAVLPSLLEFEAPLMAFGNSTIQNVAEGVLLPSITRLTIAASPIQSLDSLMTMIEERNKNSRRFSGCDGVRCSCVEKLYVRTLTIGESKMGLYQKRGRDAGCFLRFPSRSNWNPDNTWVNHK
ncbi:hypothetical protein C0995_009069 [Termitomyces sp. Mi166|nr:hypothetical protein C0995_009069 [Termitomyces sp. Mi166\